MPSTAVGSQLVHQTLHGYEDGHRLLATSLDLSPESTRLMRNLSDLSGSGTAKGFDGYLTGYPLPDGQFYVLARTWFATELKRPGCVWTHSFLLPMDSLGDFGVWNSATRHLIRPKLPSEFPDYERPVQLMLVYRSDPLILDNEIANAVFFSDRPVLIPSDEANSDENKLIDAAFYAWITAKVPLSISTGSFRSRWRGKVPFDIQVVPTGQLREVKRELDDPFVVVAAKGDTPTNLPQLTNPLAKAISEAGGVRSQRGRSYIGLVSRIADLLLELESDRISIEQVIRELLADNSLLREPRLWQTLLGGPCDRLFLRDVPEDIFLIELLQFDVTRLPLGAMQLRLRFDTLVNTQPDAAAKVLQAAMFEQSEIGNLYWQSAVDCATPSFINETFRNCPAVAIRLIATSRKLQVDKDTWIIDPALSQQAVDAISQTSQLDDSVLSAILMSKVEGVAEAIVALSASNAIAVACRIVHSAPQDQLAPDWEAVLHRHGDDCAKWLARERTTNVAVAARFLRYPSPTSQFLDTILQSDWLTWIETSANDASFGGPISTFVMCRFWERQGEEYDTVVARSFDVVHLLLSVRELPSEDIGRLASLFPDLWWSWDKCGRIRGAYVRRFTEFGSSDTAFLLGLRNIDALRTTLGAWGWSRKEYDYLKSIVRHALNGTLSTTPEQLRAMEEFSSWY